MPEDAITEVVVADERQYGTTIADIDEQETFTNDGNFVGVGKTIPREQSSGVVQSSIVIREEMIGPLLDKRTTAEKPADEQFARELCDYILCHELGHCTDNFCRRITDRVRPDDRGVFRIGQVTEYYSRILVGEFAASVHSAPGMTARVFANAVSEFRKEQTLQELDAQKRAFDGTAESLSKLAFTAAGTFWFVMIQYSKLVGTVLGTPAIGELPAAWNNASRTSESLLGKVPKMLNALWRDYPDWNAEDVQKRLEPLWQGIAFDNGFSFRRTGEGDALYFCTVSAGCAANCPGEIRPTRVYLETSLRRRP